MTRRLSTSSIEFDRPYFYRMRPKNALSNAPRKSAAKSRTTPVAAIAKSLFRIMPFSLRGATYQREEQRFDRVQVRHLRLTIVPNENGWVG